MTNLQTENAQLRARVEELERKLYPPLPEPPKEKPNLNRYVLTTDPRDYKEPWRRVEELFIHWAFDYAREQHPKLRWLTVYRWTDIPAAGIYTTFRRVLDARHAKSDIPVYEIDKRTAALDAVEVQKRRIRDRFDEQIHDDEAYSNPHDRDAHRVWAYRNQLLLHADKSGTPIDRAWFLAARPLADYGDVVRAAARAVDEVLEREHQVTLEAIPGYRPDGTWICDKCGYPFDADEAAHCFTCDACVMADPRESERHQTIVDEIASAGNQAGAESYAASRRQRLERLRWLLPPEAINA